MRKLLVLAAIVTGLAAAACNTVEGAGQDLKAAGQGITNSANDAR